MERVLIIGGTGFVGDYLLEELLKKEGLQLSVVCRSLPQNKLPKVNYHQIDASEDFEKLSEVLNQNDYLVILSRPNKKLIKNIINSKSGFKKIVYASTLLIYPNSEMKQDENAVPWPAGEYEKDKIEEEKELVRYAKESGNRLAIARLTNVYGDKKNKALIHWILSALVNNTEFSLNNEGKPVRDFIFVEDAAKYFALLTFLPQEKDVEIFNVCTGEGFSINQIVEEIELVSGRKIKIKNGLKTDEKLSVIGDNSKIINATGYAPRYNLQNGLKKAYQNYLKS